MAPKKKVVIAKAPKPEEGKLYWVQLHGKPSGWHISLHKDGLWHVLSDPMPWGSVRKFLPGPTPPAEEK
jgi:hypothetical protein